MSIHTLIPLIIILFIIFMGAILFIKTSKHSSCINESHIKELCNNEFIDSILHHLYCLMKNEHSIYENMILSDASTTTIYEIKKFYNLSSCDSHLNLKKKDFVIKNICETGNLTTANIVINTVNTFYIYNNISNSTIYGNKTNLSGINIDMIVEFYKFNSSTINKPIVKIDRIFLTKNIELKL